VYFENTGLTTLWYGASSNVTTGATGNNAGFLSVDQSKGFAGYAGSLYARCVGASNGDTHVFKVFEY
jgi:hypothetical protein